MVDSNLHPQRLQGSLRRMEIDMENAYHPLPSLATETSQNTSDVQVDMDDSVPSLSDLTLHKDEKLPYSNDRLPHDILEYIFLVCYASSGDYQKGAVLLSSVCQLWRITALSVPSLWSYMYISTNLPGSFSLAKEWLPRCTRLQLSIRCTEKWPELEDFFDLLRASKVPLQRLHVDIDHQEDLVRYFRPLLTEHSTSLEELVISDDLPQDDLPLPDLKRLYLNAFPMSWTASLPPANLTTLCLTAEVHLTAVTTIVFHCTLLEQLYVTIGEASHRFSEIAPSEMSETITHSHLRYLAVSADIGDIPYDFLHKFHFPSLRVLEYRPWDTDGDEVEWLYTHPLLHSIKRLTLQMEDDDPEMEAILTSVFEQTHALEELLIYCSPDSLDTVTSVLAKVRCLSPSHDADSEHSAFDLALHRLKRLNFGLDVEFCDFEPSAFRNLAQAWAPCPSDESNITSNNDLPGRPSLVQFSIINWSEDGNGADKLRDDIKSGIGPTCDVRLVRLEQEFWTEQFPLAFEMFPLPFSDTQRYKVLGDDGEWKVETGAIYHTW